MHKEIDTIIAEILKRILSSNLKDIDYQNILTGKLGLAQTSFYIYKSHGNIQWLNKINDILDDIFESISNETSPLLEKISLADGISGLGLVLHQLIKEGVLDESYAEQLDVITNTIYLKCKKEILKENFDYFYGSTGLLFYLLEVEAYQQVSNIVDIIYTYSINNNFSFYNNVDDPYSRGINFGFAHGSFAILSVFLEIYKKGIQKEKSKEIITNTLDGLLQFKKGTMDHKLVTIMYEGWDYPSFFPYTITSLNGNKIVDLIKDTQYHFTDRLGWCNSDLSRMYLLYSIGHILKIQHYIDIANEMAVEVIARKEEKDTAIKDCYMCHGTSGVAQIYKKIFEIDKNPIFYDAYEYWIKATVNFMEKELIKTQSNKDLELLTGWLSPMFVLSEYNGNKHEGWDRIFLLN